MSGGIKSLEEKIDQFLELIEEMKEVTREAHSTLKMMQKERREFERYISTEGKKQINDRVDETVKNELDKIGPIIREQTNQIYDRVNKEVDKLIDLCIGKEFSFKRDHEDLRPLLADKLREWIKEIIYTS